MTIVAENVITEIVAVHDMLIQEEDISPQNQRINAALGRLVEVLMQKYSAVQIAAIMDDERVMCRRPTLLARLSAAETAMERFWAERFTRMPGLCLANLVEFTYWTNYQRLVGNELRTLERSHACLSVMASQSPCSAECKGEECGSVVFVGAGPLPLSAILLHTTTGLRVHCVDIDSEACELTGKLLHKLGLHNMHVIHADGGVLEYNGVSAIFIASLVSDKERVIRRIRARNTNAVIALRSSEGLSTLLYEPVNTRALEASGFRTVAQTPPDRKTINTTLFCVPAPRPRTCDCILSPRQSVFPGETTAMDMARSE